MEGTVPGPFQEIILTNNHYAGMQGQSGPNVGGRQFEVTMLVLSRYVKSAVVPRILKSTVIEIETSSQASKMR